MAAREVTFDQFVARLSENDRRQVREARAAGMGVARFGGLNLSYGRRGAAIESKFPPAAYGSAELGDFVSPVPTPASRRSPLMDGIGGPPQIARPRVARSVTERPAWSLRLVRVHTHEERTRKDPSTLIHPHPWPLLSDGGAAGRRPSNLLWLVSSITLEVGS